MFCLTVFKVLVHDSVFIAFRDLVGSQVAVADTEMKKTVHLVVTEQRLQAKGLGSWNSLRTPCQSYLLDRYSLPGIASASGKTALAAWSHHSLAPRSSWGQLHPVTIGCGGAELGPLIPVWDGFKGPCNLKHSPRG